MQFTIKDKTFDSGRLNAFQQLHVVRRLAPVTERLVALAGSAGDPEAFLGPLARTVGELPDAETVTIRHYSEATTMIADFENAAST